jgi:cytochrome c
LEDTVSTISSSNQRTSRSGECHFETSLDPDKKNAVGFEIQLHLNFNRWKTQERTSSMVGRLLFLVVLVTSASSAWAADTSGDPIAGKTIFEHTCQNCHSTEIGVNKIGPSLWNVVGRQAASVPDFAYSEAMKNNKTAWSISALDLYLADPRGDVHGAKMFFKGLPAAKDRADVIAYLQTLK